MLVSFCAMVLLFLVLVTSAPTLLKILPSLGFARMHRLHHFLGWLFLLVTLIHAVWEVWEIQSSGLNVGLLFSDPGLAIGVLALFVMVVLFVFALRKAGAYRRWKKTHLLFVPAVFLALAHVFFMVRPFETAAFYVAVLCLLMVFALIVGRWWAPSQRFSKLLKVSDLGVGIHRLEVLKQEADVYPAGSIVLVKFPKRSGAWHPFTVASCLKANTLVLIVKRVGVDTAHLETLSLEDGVLLRGPYADFPRRACTQPQVWIASGVGIAPFVGWLDCLNYFPASLSPVIFHFIHPVDSGAYEELKHTLDLQRLGLQWNTVATLEMADLSILTPTFNLNANYYICGSDMFMKMVRKYLCSAGVPANKIQTEEMRP